MPRKNKYIKVSHISEPKFRETVKLFSKDLNATQIAHLTNLNRNTIKHFLMLFRERIVKYVKKTLLYPEKLKWMSHIMEIVEFEVKP